MRSKPNYVHLLFAVAGVLLGLSAWVVYLTWPRKLDVTLPPSLPAIRVIDGRLAVQLHTDVLLAQVSGSGFSSEIAAFLHFEYLQTHAGLGSSRVLLAAKNAADGPHFQIFLVLDNNLLTDVPCLDRIEAKGYIPGYKLLPVSFEVLARKRLETSVFVGSYNPPHAPRLAALPRLRLLTPLASFLMFKSMTDRRVREQIEPVPTTLSYAQAKQLAADILDVARFYNLPLDVFLGIGAMENNYMNIRGDLDHSVWKRRPQRGDIILKRARGRVLVSDYAMGVWQITRETLRSAHDLYLKDKRDYSALPPHLRPSKQLSFDLDDSEVLTTYAGLLLRHLLDLSNGDVAKAIGAYNGSFQRPNYQYAAGVEAVALYARSFLERAANLDGLSVGKSWLVPRSVQNGNKEISTSPQASTSKNVSITSD